MANWIKRSSRKGGLGSRSSWSQNLGTGKTTRSFSNGTKGFRVTRSFSSDGKSKQTTTMSAGGYTKRTTKSLSPKYAKLAKAPKIWKPTALKRTKAPRAAQAIKPRSHSYKGQSLPKASRSNDRTPPLSLPIALVILGVIAFSKFNGNSTNESPASQPSASAPVASVDNAGPATLASPEQSTSPASPSPSDDQPIDPNSSSDYIYLANPQWITQPSPRDFDRSYPDKALQMGQGGRVVLDCSVLADGTLRCAVESESPTGWHFAESALKLAKKYRLNAEPNGSNEIADQKHIKLPIMFRPEKDESPS